MGEKIKERIRSHPRVLGCVIAYFSAVAAVLGDSLLDYIEHHEVYEAYQLDLGSRMVTDAFVAPIVGLPLVVLLGILAGNRIKWILEEKTLRRAFSVGSFFGFFAALIVTTLFAGPAMAVDISDNGYSYLASWILNKIVIWPLVSGVIFTIFIVPIIKTSNQSHKPTAGTVCHET